MMNNLTTTRILVMILFMCTFVFTSCRDDDETPLPLPDSVVYDLESVADSTIEGTATFVRVDSRTTSITIVLTGTPTGGIHPAHIHANSAEEGGPIVISLTPVDGTTGVSNTLVQRFDDGTPVSFEELLDYDGHLNVHLSQEQLDVIVAQGNIGSNADEE